MQGSICRKRKKGSKVTVDMTTAAGFEFKRAVGGLRIGHLELEELFDNRRFGGKTPTTALARQAVRRTGVGP